jgi:P-type Mg2+ transporter
MTIALPRADTGRDVAVGIMRASERETDDVLVELGVTRKSGLSGADVARRRAAWGPNAVSSHHARLLPVLWHQLRSPLLALLLCAAATSYFVGERGSAVIIGVIVGLSVGLGFVNEYRAEKAAEALHDQIHHETVVIRDAAPQSVDVVDLVPGDVVRLALGDGDPHRGPRRLCPRHPCRRARRGRGAAMGPRRHRDRRRRGCCCRGQSDGPGAVAGRGRSRPAG